MASGSGCMAPTATSRSRPIQAPDDGKTERSRSISSKRARVDAVERLEQRQRDEGHERSEDENHRRLGERYESRQNSFSAVLTEVRCSREKLLELTGFLTHGDEPAEHGREERALGDGAMERDTVVHAITDARSLLLRERIGDRREHVVECQQKRSAAPEQDA